LRKPETKGAKGKGENKNSEAGPRPAWGECGKNRKKRQIIYVSRSEGGLLALQNRQEKERGSPFGWSREQL